MIDYWTDRALPVLQALSSPTDDVVRSGFLSLGRGRAKRNLGIEIDDDAAHATILQLNDAGYIAFNDITYETGGGAHIAGLRVTGRGLQVLGQWPRFEVLVSPGTLAALLEALAEYMPPEEAGELKRAATFVRKLSGKALTSLAVGVGGQLLRHSLGLP
jgi:hypothetical protein